MMGLLSSGKKKNQIGVDFFPHGVAVVEVSLAKNSVGNVVRHEFLKATGEAQQAQALKDWVRLHNLQKSSCVCLIADDDCQVTQIEKPAVEESELEAAVSWRIKDLISYDVKNAVIDIYPMPVSTKNNVQHVNVVSANKSIVGQYVECIKSSGLTLVAIDINELAIRNLLTVMSDEQQSIAVLSLKQHSGLINVYYESELYVSRDFKKGLEQLQLQKHQESDVDDSLMLEVQRSLDYFEGYFGLGSVRKLIIYPANEATEKMAMNWQRFASFEIEFADIKQFIQGDSEQGFNEQCFSAYCAGLRGI